MANKWELFTKFQFGRNGKDCGSGSSWSMTWKLNDVDGGATWTAQAPCTATSAADYIRDFFINSLREHRGLTDVDIIYVNGKLFYQPPGTSPSPSKSPSISPSTSPGSGLVNPCDKDPLKIGCIKIGGSDIPITYILIGLVFFFMIMIRR